MKKHLTILLSVLLTAILLIGCSNGKGEGSRNSVDTISASSENANKNDNTTASKDTSGPELKEKFLRSKEGHDFQVVSWKFAKAFLSGDGSTMKSYLLDPKSKEHFYSTENIFGDVEFLILKLDPKDIKEDSVHAEYEYGVKGKDTLQYLNLDMKRVNNEWKVQFYGVEM